MALLIVTLPLEMPGPGMEWHYVLSADGQTIQRQSRVPMALLPPLTGAGHEVVAVVPARALSWHRVTLPASLLARVSRLQGGTSPQLRAALEGLLEDELLDEPATLHLALGPQPRAGTPTWVATCQKTWLHAHLQLLEESRHAVTRIVPEFEPTTDEAAPQLHVTTGLDPAQLVRSDTNGVTVLPLGAAAIHWLAWPEAAAITAEAAVAGQAEEIFKRPTTLQSASQRWLQSARSDWNLAQFDLARLGRTRRLKQLARGWNSLRHAPQWRAARWLLVLLLGTQLVGLNALAWRERSLLAQKQAAMRDTLRQTFPDVPVIVDAPLQMERQLGALLQATGTASPRDLESMLAALTSAAPTPLTLSEIDYTASEARLRGLQLGTEETATLNARLQALGYTLRADGGAWLLRAEGTR